MYDVALTQQLLAALQQFAAAGQQFAAAHERALGALFGDLGAFFLHVGVNLHAAVLRVRGADIDLLADLVGDGRERILDGLQGAQLLRQLADLHGGDDVVRDPQGAERTEQHPAELFRDEVDDLGHERLEHIDYEHARQSPQHRELQAHVALDVQRALGVVPPLVVEHLFQHPAGEVFDGAREQHAAAEQQPEAALERPEHEQHAHHAEAVDGADGAVDEAAVDELAVRDGGEGHLGAPAEKSVDVEVPEDLEPGIGHKHEKNSSQIWVPAAILTQSHHNHSNIIT